MLPYHLQVNHPLAIPARADRLLVVFSDIEMAGGGPTDDFPQSDQFAQLLDAYSCSPYGTLPVELVFNGDTFDFLKISVDGGYPHHINERVALCKFAKCAAAHAPFFDGLQRFLAGDARRRVHFIVGNHDFELLFPAVQEAISLRLGWPEQVNFPGLELKIGGVHIEHGHQRDPMFQLDPEQLFVEYDGQQVLNLPWGSVAILDVVLPLQSTLYYLDRLKPRKKIFEHLPEVQELLTSLYWRYWTRDYLLDSWRGLDPCKKFNWIMLKEIIYRLRTRDPDVYCHPHFAQMLREEEDILLLLTGHDHAPGWLTLDHRKYLHTGCFRNEYMFDVVTSEAGVNEIVYFPLPSVYAEVWMVGDVPVRSQLIELDGVMPSAGYMPVSLFAAQPEIRGLLGTPAERDAAQDAMVAQEQQEEAEIEEDRIRRATGEFPALSIDARENVVEGLVSKDASSRSIFTLRWLDIFRNTSASKEEEEATEEKSSAEAIQEDAEQRPVSE